MTDRIEHTKGEWKPTPPNKQGQIHIHCGVKNIAQTSTGSFLEDAEEIQANAHLIAAAPDMYEALEFTFDLLEHLTSSEFRLGKDKPARDCITKALAKAKGDDR